ncbi:hypothetical protein [Kitasatospora sp. NPDC001175]|uniref:hypothetical protein n=1 Tax=Kitasatospora sp. NPDC001175 TaxID=3157103 RepID=UPI003CFF132B
MRGGGPSFGEPLFLPDENLSGAGIVGSSRTPHLRTCAPALGVRLGTDGTLSDEESARLADHQPEDPFGIEKFAWHTLYQACRAGISGGHAIVFH